MDLESFQKLVESGRESVSLEFKQSENWDSLKYKITRCILAMSNTRSGGNLIVGINNNSNLLRVEDAHINTFNEEVIKDFISNDADPFVDFELDQISYNSKSYLVFTVHEFNGTPIICKKDQPSILRKGSIYVRTRNRRPESAEITDSSHMRRID